MRQDSGHFRMPPLTKAERNIFRSASDPKKIQDLLNTLGKKTAKNDPRIVRSPRLVLASGAANCMEGALLAAAILMSQGRKAFLLDMKVGAKNEADVDHVVAVFEEGGCFGAVSKTSHAVLRYREPIYKTLRELALSYFHEYFTDDGKKNLRTFSKLFDVKKHFGSDWIASDGDLYEIAVALDESPHLPYLTQKARRGLRRADPIEIAAGKLTEQDSKKHRNMLL